MKNLINILLIIALPILGGIEGYLLANDKIDVPEEIDVISTESLHPDTLLGYRDGKGVLHIQYMH